MVTCAPIACKHKVSGSVSLPSRGSFHLSLTVLFSIGHWVVFRLGGWAPRLQTGLHVSGPTLVPSGILCISPTGISPSSSDLSRVIRLYMPCFCDGPQPRQINPPVWPLSRSLAATWEIDVSFSSCGYLDVSVLRVSSSCTTLLMHVCPHITVGGFPHSDICGSRDMCSSPQLFAACHVLLRLPVPRHPPDALVNLTINTCTSVTCRIFLHYC